MPRAARRRLSLARRAACHRFGRCTTFSQKWITVTSAGVQGACVRGREMERSHSHSRDPRPLHAHGLPHSNPPSSARAALLQFIATKRIRVRTPERCTSPVTAAQRQAHGRVGGRGQTTSAPTHEDASDHAIHHALPIARPFPHYHAGSTPINHPPCALRNSLSAAFMLRRACNPHARARA